MSDLEILEQLNIDLQFLGDNNGPSAARIQGYLTGLIARAKELIRREGITLTDSAEDGGLVEMYAAYLYRKRAADNAPMPRMLRWALNNRVISEKAGVEE